MLNAGEQGLVVEFGDGIDPEINAKVQILATSLATESLPGILEIVPTYRSLLIYFDPLVLSRLELSTRIAQLIENPSNKLSDTKETRVVFIPVCYGDEFGPDIQNVAQHNSLSVDEVIAIHTATPYLVYMLGFTPGFPYLGGLSPKIATPRLTTPRTKIPAGSVGIAGSQTGFYPIESPGGWQLIGRTPVKAFDPMANNPFLFKAGDYLQFEAVTKDDFHVIKAEVDKGTYSPKIKHLTDKQDGEQK